MYFVPDSTICLMLYVRYRICSFKKQGGYFWKSQEISKNINTVREFIVGKK
jgi:hypothetical protein